MRIFLLAIFLFFDTPLYANQSPYRAKIKRTHSDIHMLYSEIVEAVSKQKESLFANCFGTKNKTDSEVQLKTMVSVDLIYEKWMCDLQQLLIYHEIDDLSPVFSCSHIYSTHQFANFIKSKQNNCLVKYLNQSKLEISKLEQKFK